MSFRYSPRVVLPQTLTVSTSTKKLSSSKRSSRESRTPPVSKVGCCLTARLWIQISRSGNRIMKRLPCLSVTLGPSESAHLRSGRCLTWGWFHPARRWRLSITASTSRRSSCRSVTRYLVRSPSTRATMPGRSRTRLIRPVRRSTRPRSLPQTFTSTATARSVLRSRQARRLTSRT